MGEEFVGPGWAFPLRIDPTGGSPWSSGTAEIEESIRLILRPRPASGRCGPSSAARVHDYVFAPADAATAGDIAYDVRVALDRWEPRIDLERRRSSGSTRSTAACCYIDIEYAVRGTNDPRNLVFPFYVIPDEEDRCMSASRPNLDDRRFQDLVDDAKRMVQQRCPEWTDHNVSDPGRHADRDVRVHDRPAALPAQPGAGPALHQVPRPARRDAAPADRRRASTSRSGSPRHRRRTSCCPADTRSPRCAPSRTRRSCSRPPTTW